MTDRQATKPPKPPKYDLFLIRTKGSIVEPCIAGVMTVFGKTKDEAVNIFLASTVAPGGYLGRFSLEVAETHRKALARFAASANSEIAIHMVESSKFDKLVNPDLDQYPKKRT
jgi:ATP-dependent Clp protease adapter protein ClpS